MVLTIMVINHSSHKHFLPSKISLIAVWDNGNLKFEVI